MPATTDPIARHRLNFRLQLVRAQTGHSPSNSSTNRPQPIQSPVTACPIIRKGSTSSHSTLCHIHARKHADGKRRVCTRHTYTHTRTRIRTHEYGSRTYTLHIWTHTGTRLHKWSHTANAHAYTYSRTLYTPTHMVTHLHTRRRIRATILVAARLRAHMRHTRGTRTTCLLTRHT